MIIGVGPAGNNAATYAARLGARVTMVERDVIGGAAHLLDCIPSKTMIATGGAMSFSRRIGGMGLEQQDATVDVGRLTERVESIKTKLSDGVATLLGSQGVELVKGSARMVGPHQVEIASEEGVRVVEADAVLIASGASPRVTATRPSSAPTASPSSAPA